MCLPHGWAVVSRLRTAGGKNGWVDGRWRTDVERGDAQGGDRERRNVKAAALESDLGRKVALPWRPGESSVAAAAAAAERKGGSGAVDWPFKEQRGCLPNGSGGGGQQKPGVFPGAASETLWTTRIVLFGFIYPGELQTILPLFFSRSIIGACRLTIRWIVSWMSCTGCSCIFNGFELSGILWITVFNHCVPHTSVQWDNVRCDVKNYAILLHSSWRNKRLFSSIPLSMSALWVS